MLVRQSNRTLDNVRDSAGFVSLHLLEFWFELVPKNEKISFLETVWVGFRSGSGWLNTLDYQCQNRYSLFPSIHHRFDALRFVVR